MQTRKILAVSMVFGISLGAAVWFGLLRDAVSASQEKRPARPFLTQLPKIKSCVEHVKVVDAQLVDQAGSQVLVVELENQAFIDVVSVSVEQLYRGGKDSVVSSGFSPDSPPSAVILPGQRRKMTVANLHSQSLIRIAGVMFSDGTEEGCESSLRDMREVREHNKKAGPK